MFNLKDRLDEDFANTIWGKELLKEVDEELVDILSTFESISKNLHQIKNQKILSNNQK